MVRQSGLLNFWEIGSFLSKNFNGTLKIKVKQSPIKNGENTEKILLKTPFTFSGFCISTYIKMIGVAYKRIFLMTFKLFSV